MSIVVAPLIAVLVGLIWIRVKLPSWEQKDAERGEVARLAERAQVEPKKVPNRKTPTGQANACARALGYLNVPAKTAAMLEGWKNLATMQRLYQKPSGSDLFAAAVEVGTSR